MRCNESHKPKWTIRQGRHENLTVSVHAYCAEKGSSVYVWINGVCVSFRIPHRWGRCRRATALREGEGT